MSSLQCHLKKVMVKVKCLRTTQLAQQSMINLLLVYPPSLHGSSEEVRTKSSWTCCMWFIVIDLLACPYTAESMQQVPLSYLHPWTSALPPTSTFTYFVLRPSGINPVWPPVWVCKEMVLMKVKFQHMGTGDLLISNCFQDLLPGTRYFAQGIIYNPPLTALMWVPINRIFPCVFVFVCVGGLVSNCHSHN